MAWQRKSYACYYCADQRETWLVALAGNRQTNQVYSFSPFDTAMFLSAAPDQAALVTYGNLPLAFEETRGQAPLGVSYLSRTRTGMVFLRLGSVTLVLLGHKRQTFWCRIVLWDHCAPQKVRAIGNRVTVTFCNVQS